MSELEILLMAALPAAICAGAHICLQVWRHRRGKQVRSAAPQKMPSLDSLIADMKCQIRRYKRLKQAEIAAEMLLRADVDAVRLASISTRLGRF